VGLGALCLAGMLAGCAEPDVRIIGRCEVVTGAVRVTGDEGGWLVGPVPAVGMLDGLVLFEWTSHTGREYAPTVQWHDAELRPLGEPAVLGWGFGMRTQWVRGEGALWGQAWVDPALRLDEVPDDEHVHVVELRPGDAPRLEPIALELADTIPGISRFGISGNYVGGFGEYLPGVVTARGFRGALVGAPRRCGRIETNYWRLHLLGEDLDPAAPVLWGEEPCNGLGEAELSASNPWLVDLGDGGVGVLVRLWSVDPRVRYMRVSPSGEVLAEPRLVGGGIGSELGTSFHPRAARAGAAAIVFAERRGGPGSCHALRVMGLDGAGARDAPWQLPCRRGASVATAWVELVGVPAGAVLVWGERTWTNSGLVTASTRYREGIYAVLLTAEGQRGSEVLEVTDEAATALADVPRTEDFGPFPEEFLMGAASEGEDVVVAWHDTRPGAPGVRARRLSCAALP